MAAVFLLLFVTGVALGGTVSTLTLTAASVVGGPMRAWTMPVVLYVSYVSVYFIGGKHMLRGHVSTTLVRGVIVSSGWFTVTVWITFAATGAIGEPSAGALLSAGRILLAWLLVLVAAATLLIHRHRALS